MKLHVVLEVSSGLGLAGLLIIVIAVIFVLAGKWRQGRGQRSFDVRFREGLDQPQEVGVEGALRPPLDVVAPVAADGGHDQPASAGR